MLSLTTESYGELPGRGRLYNFEFWVAPDHPGGQQGASEFRFGMPRGHINNDSFTFTRCHIIKFIGYNLVMGPLDKVRPHMLHET